MPTDRRATPEEIETAKAWVEQTCAGWPEFDEHGIELRTTEYERALAVLVFAADRRPTLSADVRTVDGRREVWDDAVPPGGWVCAEPMPALPDGICGMPVEDEPCSVHHPWQGEPDDDPPDRQ